MSDSFKCIAVETATENCSVAAANNSASAVVELSSSKQSAHEVYDAIQEALDQVELRLDELDCIAFGCGPGGFTGLRIAAGVAQGLAYSRSLPVCRISTLAALAVAAGDLSGHGHVAACLDARMGEAYLGLYQNSEGKSAQPVSPDRLCSPDSIDLADVPGGWLAAGPGWLAWPDLLGRNSAHIASQATDIWPDADAVLKLARLEFARGNTVTADAAVPNYIRDQVTG